MKKICLYSSYSPTDRIDNYIKYYLNDLCQYFDEIIFITNTREICADDLNYINQNPKITLKMVQNQGYDFGMYWHVIKDLNVNLYQTVALVNDSCYLIRSLKPFFTWYSNFGADVSGITDSIFKGHHIQSYFLIFSKRVLQLVKAYFIKYGIVSDVHKLIETYEIGLCKYLIDGGFKLSAMYSQKMFNDHNSNIVTEKMQELLAKGIPIIKRKLVNNTFREDETSYLEHVNFDFSVDYKKLLYSYIDHDTLAYILQNQQVKVYQIYYDLDQIKFISPDCLPYYNSGLTVYFENELIKNFYTDNKIEADYFGILSWRFSQKNGFQYNSALIDGRYDLYAFQGTTRNHIVLGDSNMCHPYFNDIFKHVLRNLKLNIEEVSPLMDLGLYMNAVIARTAIYKDYVANYLIPTMNFLDNLGNRFPEVYQKLWSDAKYKYDPALTTRLHQHTTKPYYTYHTFICERLWSVYYAINKSKLSLKILTAKDTIAPSTVPVFVPPQPNKFNTIIGSVVEEVKQLPEPILVASDKQKDFAICVAHLGDRHTLENIHPENDIFDFYLVATENLEISKWHRLFRKNKIINQKIIDDVNSIISKGTLLNMYLCSSVTQLWQEQEHLNKRKYKVVVYCNNLSALSQKIDLNNLKINPNTIYIKKGTYKYWIAKADVMETFNQLYPSQSTFKNGSFDDIILQFALRRNIKIIEIS